MQYALFAVFLALVALFLYREKVKFQPPTPTVLTAWRLAHFGAAVFFLAGAVFFGLGGNGGNSVGFALVVGVPMAASVAAVLAGFVLLFVRGGGK